jgi:RNA polymerase sigma factor (sigma-70 family)
MTDEAWPSLLSRLEDDLRARRAGNPSGLDDNAWLAAYSAIRRFAVIMSSRAHLSPEEIDEIIQDALIKLQKPATLRRLRMAGSPAGYLAVLIRHLIIDKARRRKRVSFVELPLREDLLPLQSDPRGALEEEKMARLREALTSLRPEDIVLLRLRFWLGFSIQQIAEKNDLSYSATAVRLFRILKNLRQKLGVQ